MTVRRSEAAVEAPDVARTMFDKIWDAHEVADGLIYIDLHLVHEVTSPQAFDGLRLEGRRLRRPDRTIATDHSVPTDGTPTARLIADELSRFGSRPWSEIAPSSACRSTRSVPRTRGSST